MDIDTKIVELFAIVAKQKADIEVTEELIRRGWKTTCSIKLPWNGVNLNIQTATSDALEEIVMYLGMILSAKQTIGTGFKIQGFFHDDWMDDVKKRIAVMESRMKKAELDELEKRLDSIVSPEQRRELELKAIMEKLGEK